MPEPPARHWWVGCLSPRACLATGPPSSVVLSSKARQLHLGMITRCRLRTPAHLWVWCCLSHMLTSFSICHTPGPFVSSPIAVMLFPGSCHLVAQEPKNNITGRGEHAAKPAAQGSAKPRRSKLGRPARGRPAPAKLGHPGQRPPGSSQGTCDAHT